MPNVPRHLVACALLLLACGRPDTAPGASRDSAAPAPAAPETLAVASFEPVGPGAVVFDCQGGAQLHARFSADSVILWFPSVTVTLPRAEAASGARYGNTKLSFWEDQGVAVVTRGDSTLHRGCRRRA